MSNKEHEYKEPNYAFDPVRQQVNIQVGSIVACGDTVYRIEQVLDFQSVIAVDVASGRSTPLRIGELRPVVDSTSRHEEIDQIADEDWRIAEQRFAAIKPLLDIKFIGRTEVARRAKEVNVDTATLYRWMQRYNAYGVVSALIPQKRGWKTGKSRIAIDAVFVIEEVINDFHLTTQRPSIQKTVTEVERQCMLRGISAPNKNTIRARISKVNEKQLLRGRGQKEKAKNKFLPAPGSFPNANYPLAVIQIDHTPADIILVDDIHRKPIGRPWITLAMDIYSRMVVGYYLSFDAPSETSVAMCVAHAVLPKDEWLTLHNVDAEWNVWGMPVTIHTDNGADFRSNNFQQSCLMYGINLEFRPVRQPNYGGHIERVLGTFLREIHDLPGTTFSNIKEKDSYNSEKEAVLTMSEFEAWLVTLICKVYHQKLHSSIGMTPTRKWEIGVFGNSEVQGCGVPARPADRFTVLLDFLPSFSRTVQTFGVTIDGLNYYAEALRPWINLRNPDNKNKKCTYIFRRDPRDISAIWFFDPLLKQYFKIPFADLSLPSVSIWEYQQAKDVLKREGAKSINEHQVLHAITELRSKVDKAKESTKKARRQAQRRVEHEKQVSPANPLPVKSVTSITSSLPTSGLISGDIDDFGDIA
ncbi:MAG: DDE-type integrase/transposase/recombinase [Methylotenera sp.]